MKFEYKRELSKEERDILFTKVRQYIFKGYKFKREFGDILELYGEDNLDILYAYVKEDMHVENDEESEEEDKKEAIRKYASLSKKSLFRLQILYSLLGCGLASSHLGEQFLDRGEYEIAFAWFKKSLRQGNRIETGRGLMKILHRHYRTF